MRAFAAENSQIATRLRSSNIKINRDQIRVRRVVKKPLDTRISPHQSPTTTSQSGQAVDLKHKNRSIDWRGVV